jgi:parvulin-like peptidyl-prolyl isomerase
MLYVKNKLVLLLVIVLIASFPVLAAAKAAPKKAAPKAPAASAKSVKPVEWAFKVNGDIISMELYNKRLAAAVKQITKEISPEAAEEKGIIQAVKKAIAEQMIEAVILLQWAEQEGIDIKEKSIKANIQELKKTFPSAKEFHQSLAEQGMTIADLERDVKKQMVIEKLIVARAKNMAVSDEEIKSFYDKNIELYLQKPKMHLSQEFFKSINEAKVEKANLEGGSSFEGEDLGLIEESQLPVNDPSAVFLLKTDELSGVVSGEDGFYVFKALSKTPGKETKLEDVKNNIRKFLLMEKARTKYLKDLQEEKAGAKIILNEKLGKLF